MYISNFANSAVSAGSYNHNFCGPAPLPKSLIAELEEYGVVEKVGDSIICSDGTEVAVCWVRDILSSTIEEVRPEFPICGGASVVYETWVIGNGCGKALVRVTLETHEPIGVWNPTKSFTIKIEKL